MHEGMWHVQIGKALFIDESKVILDGGDESSTDVRE